MNIPIYLMQAQLVNTVNYIFNKQNKKYNTFIETKEMKEELSNNRGVDDNE